MFVFIDHPPRVFEEVTRLVASGESDYAIGQILGISPNTVKRWRTRGRPGRRRPAFERAKEVAESLDEASYSYLLGMYLGDGHVGRLPRTCSLVISCDPKYPSIIEECRSRMDQVAPGNVHVQPRSRDAVIVVVAYWAAWPILIPQSGPGRKHERLIALEEWQTQITHRYVKPFLRGLIHSDGSRCLNRFDTMLPSGRNARYEYPRYFFTNYSEDIRRIFCEHCELLGIRWTQSNWKNISISHRDSVALLDDFVGPKM